MSALSFKPLRKPVHLLQITDEEINWKMADRRRAMKYFSALPAGSRHKKEASEKKSGTKLLHDARGKVENILFTLPPHYDQKNPDVPVDPWDADHVRMLLRHLSKRRRHYTILCHASQIKTVKRWFREFKVPEKDYTIAISVFNYSIWAQDAYVAVSDKSMNTYLAESVCFTRDHDMSVADDVSMQSNIRRMQSPLYFQGGNILCTGSHAIVGMDYIFENLGRVSLESTGKVISAFEGLLGHPVIALGRQDLIPHRHRQYLGGGIFQPIFHIDMYVTATNVTGKNNREIILVGSPRLARKILREKEQETDFDMYFDEAAKALAKHFDVRRLPLLPSQYKSKEMQICRHYYLSYNNSLVESYTEKGKKHQFVYMPAFEKSVDQFISDHHISQYYGDAKKYRKLDKAAQKIWESLGFRVFRMEAFEDLAMSWGSVHCIVKAVKRSAI